MTTTITGKAQPPVSTSLTGDDLADLAAFEAMRDLIRDRTRSVAERYQTGAYLVGRPGTSKTFTIIEWH